MTETVAIPAAETLSVAALSILSESFGGLTETATGVFQLDGVKVIDAGVGASVAVPA